MRALLTLALLVALASPAEARLDRDFAKPRGWRALSVGAHESGADRMIRTRSGKLLVAGFADEPRTYETVFGLARLHPSGRLDRRFGRRGRALVDTGDTGTVVGLHELPSRKLLFAYWTYGENGAIVYHVVRLRPGGRIDRRYGDRGVARITAPAANASLAGMAALPGGAVALAGTAGETSADRRVVVLRVAANGRSSSVVESLDLGGARAVALVRTRLGHLVVAANRHRVSGQPDGAILTGLGPNPFRRELEGTKIVDLERDRRAGVVALLDKGYRWGVRRFAEDLRPRRAPMTMTSRGNPSALAVAPRGAAWVGFPGGAIRRVRPDGRLDRRGNSPSLRTRYMLDTAALVAMPRNRVAAAGRAFPQDFGDIREDYGVPKMWIGRFRR